MINASGLPISVVLIMLNEFLENFIQCDLNIFTLPNPSRSTFSLPYPPTSVSGHSFDTAQPSTELTVLGTDTQANSHVSVNVTDKSRKLAGVHGLSLADPR